MKAFIVALALTVCSANVYADLVTDKTIKDSMRFLEAKPEVVEWPRTEKTLADAWERTLGLSKLVFLRYDGSLPPKQLRGLNRRLMKLRELPRIIIKTSDEGRHLTAMIDLFAEYADMYISGRIKYSAFASVDDYVKSYGQRLAEKMRGKAYAEDKCGWSDDKCKPPPEYWEQ